MGNTKEEILLNKLGIGIENIPLLIGPQVDYHLSKNYCKQKNIPLSFCDIKDFKYFNFNTENLIYDIGNIQNEFLDLLDNLSKNNNSKYKTENLEQNLYLRNIENIKMIGYENFNKLILKKGLDVLNENFSLNLKLPHQLELSVMRN